MRRIITVVLSTLAIIATATTLSAAPAGAAVAAPTEDAQFIEAINDLRVSVGVAPLTTVTSLSDASRVHSVSMANAGTIFHANDITVGAPVGWQKAGENVGMGPGVSSLMQAFINSPGHYQNLVDPSFTHLGVGTMREGSLLFTTHRFVKLPASSPPPDDLPFGDPEPEPTPKPAEPKPAPSVAPLTSRGTDTIGVLRGRDVMLRNTNTSGAADAAFAYGKPGDDLIFGDWDGNGTDTIGVQRGRELFLRNSNTSGPADYVFAYGKPGDELIFGDWDGNGTDTIGVVRGRNIFLRNSNTSGPADYVFAYGKPTDELIFGDWDGNGTDTIGVQRGRELFLRNSNTSGPADYVFAYGKPGDELIFGDWDGR